MATGKIDPKNPPTILTMGLGAVITGFTDFGGMPGILLVPAEKPGPLDGDATDQVDEKTVSSNAVVIRFATVDAALAHIDLVKRSVEAFEKGLKK